MTENVSVLTCSWYLLSEVTNSYGNIQNKMWNTVSYFLPLDYFIFFISVWKIPTRKYLGYWLQVLEDHLKIKNPECW